MPDWSPCSSLSNHHYVIFDHRSVISPKTYKAKEEISLVSLAFKATEKMILPLDETPVSRRINLTVIVGTYLLFCEWEQYDLKYFTQEHNGLPDPVIV